MITGTVCIMVAFGAKQMVRIWHSWFGALLLDSGHPYLLFSCSIHMAATDCIDIVSKKKGLIL